MLLDWAIGGGLAAAMGVIMFVWRYNARIKADEARLGGIEADVRSLTEFKQTHTAQCSAEHKEIADLISALDTKIDTLTNSVIRLATLAEHNRPHDRPWPGTPTTYYPSTTKPNWLQ